MKLQSNAPQFVEQGHCLWCNKKLTGKATKYCRPTKAASWDYGASACAIYFSNWWYSRPAYIRATFLRDNFTCQECGFHRMQEDRPWLPDFSNLECDHIIPLARGGQTEMSNLQTLCRDCNRKKGIRVDGDEEEVGLPHVIPLRDKTTCPSCRKHGYRVLPWAPPPSYDPLMIKVECIVCRAESYVAPAPWGRRRKLNRKEEL